MQGIVLDIDLKSNKGLVRADDGRRYEFKTDACRNGVPLTGSVADFEIKDNAAVDIYTVKTSLKAKLDWLFWFLFSFRGRISRDQFVSFLALSIILLPFPAAFSLLASLSDISGSFFGFMSLLLIYVCLTVVIKRFHDVGASAFWVIFTMVQCVFLTLIMSGVLNLPLIGAVFVYVLIALLALSVIFCLYLCFARGNIGENRYGAEPYVCRTVRLK